MLGPMSVRYEIVIAGPAGPTVLGAFEGFEVAPSPPDRSRLVGALTDEAALHGVLHRLHDLHVELLEVRRLSDGPSR